MCWHGSATVTRHCRLLVLAAAAGVLASCRHDLGSSPPNDGSDAEDASSSDTSPADTAEDSTGANRPSLETPRGTDAKNDALVCTAPMADCDDNPATGCEANLNTQDGNCGACKHDCRGGVCLNGACQPLTFLAKGRPYGMAVDGSNFYWVNDEAGDVVMACDLPRCAAGPRRIAPDMEGAYYVVVDSSFVYWNSNSHDKIHACPLAGCQTPIPVLSVQSPTALAIDEMWIYFSDNLGNIQRVKKDGSSLQPVASGLVNSAEIRTYGSDVYLASGDVDVVGSVPKTGGAVATIVAKDPGGLAVDGSGFYWSVAGQIIRRTNAKNTTIVDEAEAIGGIVLSSDAIVWATAAGNIYSMPKAGGQKRTLARNQIGTAHVIGDENAVYWSNYTGRTVHMVAR